MSYRSSISVAADGANRTNDKSRGDPLIADNLYAVPLQPYRYLVYAPDCGAAFVANARLVNRIADLYNGAPLDTTIFPLLKSLGITEQPNTTGLFPPLRVAVELVLRENEQVMSESVALGGLAIGIENAVARGAPRARVRFTGREECADAWHLLEHTLTSTRARLTSDEFGLDAIAVVTGTLDDNEIGQLATYLTTPSSYAATYSHR
ncbi:MAG: hypothetical protein IPG76_00095 [Acidobacteria bacterium]|nr:hypothetical protein [Acidobacteriota bacterium]